MDDFRKVHSRNCDVCGGATAISEQKMKCPFCGFAKRLDRAGSHDNSELIFADDINEFFKCKYKKLGRGDTFELRVPVSRFYNSPAPIPGQLNFFKSKNIMFLLEQHGFQFVSRKSRFSSLLSLVVRKV